MKVGIIGNQENNQTVYNGIMQGLVEGLSMNYDTSVNLCDDCQFCFADCDNGIEGVNFFFGNGLGDDNVWLCETFLRREE